MTDEPGDATREVLSPSTPIEGPEPTEDEANSRGGDEKTDAQTNPLLRVWPSADELIPPENAEPGDDAAQQVISRQHDITTSIKGVIRAALNQVPADAGIEGFAEAEHVTSVIEDALHTAYGSHPDAFTIAIRLLLHELIGTEFRAWRAKNDLIDSIKDFRGNLTEVDLG